MPAFTWIGRQMQALRRTVAAVRGGPRVRPPEGTHGPVPGLVRPYVGEVSGRRQALGVAPGGEATVWRALSPAQAPPWHEVRATLERVERACRQHPLAARIMALTTDFVVGPGVRVEGHPFAEAFWDDPLNAMARRTHRWCDELTRTGELFLVLSRNRVTGMSYVREVPARQIDEIETDPDDLERALRYHQLTSDPEGRWWLAPQSAAGEGGRDADGDAPGGADPGGADPDGPADQIMLHYTVNRPVGEVRGRSDLAQAVPWLERYEMWLEDRVRINRFKGAYVWHVQLRGALPAQLEAKRAQYSRIPAPGSIVVSDANEEWRAVQPQIGADDVEADGRAIRLMIAAGTGVPLHYLSEGEGANRATAREMGVATYQHYRHRQLVFGQILEDVVRVAAKRAGLGPITVRAAFRQRVFGEEAGGDPSGGSQACGGGGDPWLSE